MHSQQLLHLLHPIAFEISPLSSAKSPKVILLRPVLIKSVLPYIELDVGKLVKDPYFTLLQSVGALEVSYSHTTV